MFSKSFIPREVPGTPERSSIRRRGHPRTSSMGLTSSAATGRTGDRVSRSFSRCGAVRTRCRSPDRTAWVRVPVHLNLPVQDQDLSKSDYYGRMSMRTRASQGSKTATTLQKRNAGDESSASAGVRVVERSPAVDSCRHGQPLNASGWESGRRMEA